VHPELQQGFGVVSTQPFQPSLIPNDANRAAAVCIHQEEMPRQRTQPAIWRPRDHPRSTQTLDERHKKTGTCLGFRIL